MFEILYRIICNDIDVIEVCLRRSAIIPTVAPLAARLPTSLATAPAPISPAARLAASSFITCSPAFLPTPPNPTVNRSAKYPKGAV